MGLTIDCASPKRPADFWVLAVGYEHEPLPDGYTSWDEYWVP